MTVLALTGRHELLRGLAFLVVYDICLPTLTAMLLVEVGPACSEITFNHSKGLADHVVAQGFEVVVDDGLDTDAYADEAPGDGRGDALILDDDAALVDLMDGGVRELMLEHGVEQADEVAVKALVLRCSEIIFSHSKDWRILCPSRASRKRSATSSMYRREGPYRD